MVFLPDPPCDQAASAQFVDGGYVEPTSLAALADTAPLLMAKIAAVNEERTDEQPWLVPMVLYLRNTQGYDLAQDIARAESEPLVPITGAAAKVHLTAEDAWIQRITLAMPSACPDGDDARRLPGDPLRTHPRAEAKFPVGPWSSRPPPLQPWSHRSDGRSRR